MFKKIEVPNNGENETNKSSRMESLDSQTSNNPREMLSTLELNYFERDTEFLDSLWYGPMTGIPVNSGKHMVRFRIAYDRFGFWVNFENTARPYTDVCQMD